jgi:signal transduction histidine kinase
MTRWTIQRRILLPVLSIIVPALVISSGLSAWWSARAARRHDEERLGRVVQTLTVRGFPLSDVVLARMSGLSGAEFVVTHDSGDVAAGTLQLEPADRSELADWLHDEGSTVPEARPTVTLGGREFLAKRVPLDATAAEPQRAWLVVLSPQQGWWLTNRQAIVPPIAVGLGACVLLVSVVTLTARRLARPLRSLGEHASAVAEGRFRPLGLQPDTRELQELVRAINQMVERLGRYEEEVRRHERLRTLGQLSGGIAHQLRNAATGARMAVDLHRRDCGARGDDEALDVADQQLALMESYLQRFVRLGAPADDMASGQPLSLTDVIASVVALVTPHCRHAGVELHTRAGGSPRIVWGSREALAQLLVNLVLNAIEAARHPSLARRAVTIELDGDAQQAVVRVLDTGPGPAPHVSLRIFEPFVTEKPDGAGLGLSVAREIAAAHGGEIEWHRESGVTCFTVRLPIYSEETHAATVDCR